MDQIVLMYHDVYNQTPNESGLASDMYKISAEQFEKQIKEICAFEKSNPGSIVLTFDDGGSSFYEPISYILDKYSLKGYFFIATKYIGTTGFLTKEQIADIDKRGHYIGSHSHSHPDNLSAFDPKEIENEWSESLHILSGIVGHSIDTGSIPNGYQSKTVLIAAQKAGINKIFTSKPTCKNQEAYGIKLYGRYVVLDDMTVEDVLSLVSNNKVRRKLYVKWLVLSVVKFILGNKYESIKQKIFK